MDAEIRQVGRHAVVYGAGVAVSRLASFIMLPVYTRVLSPADYGVLELLSTTLDVIAMVAGLGLSSGVFKHLAETESEENRRELISTVAIGTTALSFCVMAVGLVAAPLLNQLVFRGAQPDSYFRIFFVIYFLQNFATFALLIVQAEHRPVEFVAYNVARLIATLALNILLVVHFRMGVYGVLYANIAASSIVFVVLAIRTFGRYGVHFSRARLSQLSRFGAPIAIFTIGSFIMTFSDRYFLNYFATEADVGVYALAYKFAFLLSALAVGPFNQSWEPQRFKVARSEGGAAVYRRVFSYFNLGLFFAAIAIVLFLRDGLVVLTRPAYFRATNVVPLLLVATIVQQWTGFCNVGLYLKGKTELYGLASVIGAVAALVLNALLIPPFGIYGAAWATVAAYAIRFAAVLHWSQESFRIDYGWAQAAAMFLLLGGAWMLRWLAEPLSFWPSLTVSVAALILTAFVIYLHLLDNAARTWTRTIAARLTSPLRAH
jgi:O-antigen/teichoic acid export membrane protein